jgi:hypothetical protein
MRKEAVSGQLLAISFQLLNERRKHSLAFQCPVSDPLLIADG